jgi:hypothetical protein
VHVEGAAALMGQLRAVKIASVLPNSLKGVLAEETQAAPSLACAL